MDRPDRQFARLSRLAAAGSAAVVAVGLVSAPAGPGSETPRPFHSSAIQLQAAVNELTSITLSTTAPTTAAKTPQANITLPEIKGVVTSVAFEAAVVALVPIWYAATPITLPASLGIALFLYTWLSAIGLTFTPGSGVPAPLLFLGFGLAGWAVGPLYVLSQATQSLSKYVNSLLSQPDSAGGSASTSQAPRQAPRAKSGLAGSRRTVTTSTTADRTPSAHRAAKTTTKASNDKKHSGTARSARPTKTSD
jgi:hypothetical protein